MNQKAPNLKVVKDNDGKKSSKTSALSPREIVSELERYVIGQTEAKRAVAVALRNRWRRQALSDDMKQEVLPKNILMIGPTGVGKQKFLEDFRDWLKLHLLRLRQLDLQKLGMLVGMLSKL